MNKIVEETSSEELKIPQLALQPIAGLGLTQDLSKLKPVVCYTVLQFRTPIELASWSKSSRRSPRGVAYSLPLKTFQVESSSFLRTR
ncbi:hypothetical protein DMENIID0001_168220 [Sergentomyia squamirostris]